MGTATFSSSKSTVNTKAGVNFKRVAFGWNPTEWLNLEVGRQANPLYTTPMVWDADLTPDALVERLKFKTAGGTEIFVTGMQMEYLGARLTTNGGIAGDTAPSTSNGTTELLATQAGFKMPITDASSLKAAATYTTYTRGLDRNSFSNSIFYGINNLSTIEVPAEFNYFLSSGIGIRAYGDYVYNTNANKRASNFAVGTSAGSDDYSWLLGIKVASAKDLKAFEGNKASAGDWSAALWYQETGLFSIDPNLVDSDFFDSRINMKGAIFKAQYNLEDNVAINFSYGHGERLNKKYNAVGSGDMGYADAMGNFDLIQTDLTYKF